MPAGSRISMKVDQRKVLRDRRRRPRNIRAAADRSGQSRCAAAPGRGARGRRAVFARRPRRRAVHPHQCRRRDRLQDRHRAARLARACELARLHPASPGRLYPRSSISMPAIWCGWSAPTRCPPSSSAISRRATSMPSPSTRRPIRWTPWAATSSTRRICASPIRR